MNVPEAVGAGGVLRDEQDRSRQVTSHERVWQGLIFTVDADEVVLAPGQAPLRRQVVAHHDAVNVVALREGQESSQPDGAAEILMVRQYRHPVRANLWEVPAGLMDLTGEDAVVTAQRELAEETDYRAEQWHVLVDYYASPGFTTEGCRSFLARGLSLLPEAERSEREAEEAEMVATWFRFDDVLEGVMQGRLHNPSTVMGVLATAAARARGYEGLREAGAVWMRSPESL